MTKKTSTGWVLYHEKNKMYIGLKYHTWVRVKSIEKAFVFGSKSKTNLLMRTSEIPLKVNIEATRRVWLVDKKELKK